MKPNITSLEDFKKAISGVTHFALWRDTRDGTDWWEERCRALRKLKDGEAPLSIFESYIDAPPSIEKAAFARRVAVHIDTAFVWDTTEQGSDYWNDVVDALNQYAQDMLDELNNKKIDHGVAFDEDTGEALK